MTDHLTKCIEKQSRDLAGLSPVKQHIILLKLSELMREIPDFSIKPTMGASPQRQWIAEVGALIKRISTEKQIQFNAVITTLTLFWDKTTEQIQGIALDAIEELKLELELSGRADIGSAYSPGEIYKFFVDLKSIVNGAESEIFLIDPYFDGEAFNNYLSGVYSGIVKN